MRYAVWLVFGLVALGWVASEIEVPAQVETEVVDTGWRRTADGWEWRGTWEPLPKEYEPVVHPLVVGSLQVLLSLWVLIAWPAGQTSPRDEGVRGVARWRPRPGKNSSRERTTQTSSS